MSQGSGSGWTSLIDDIVAGRFLDPATGKAASVPIKTIAIDAALDGREADLILPLKLGRHLALVADSVTWDVLGSRVATALKARFAIDAIILDAPHADLATAAALAAKTGRVEGLVAIGSGTLNDLVKHVACQSGRPYAVFATAPSMNGYGSATASLALESGLKVSLPSRSPLGVFVDLAVNAAAPPRLAAAGFGDCLCRPVAQVDWWLSHRLLGTPYFALPYDLQAADEREVCMQATRLQHGDIVAVGHLARLLVLSGLGMALTGMSNHASMGEHQISHYIDCFAGLQHRGSLHGEQVAVASLTMARLQQRILALPDPPVLRPSVVREDDLIRRMPPEIVRQCREEWTKKAVDQAGADRLNARLQAIWPAFRLELSKFMVEADVLKRWLQQAGAPTTPSALGLEPSFYRDAILQARLMRNRYSMLDLAADAGLLEGFAEEEIGHVF